MSSETINTPWSTVGYLTYKRTYSRRIEGQNRTEEWPETVERVIAAANDQLKCDFLPEQQERLRRYMLELKGTVAGRFLWQLGTPLIEKLGLPSLQNCFSSDTQFLTKDGLKTFADFEDGDSVIIRGRNGWKNATIKSFGEQEIVELVVRRHGRQSQIIRTTANHRWNVATKNNRQSRINTTIELQSGDYLLRAPRLTNYRLTPCNIGIQHGLVFGDGHYEKTSDACAIVPCGDSAQEIRNQFIHGHNSKKAIYGLPNWWKSAPTGKENKHYILGFLSGWFAADGSVSPEGTMTLCSAHKEHLEHGRFLLSLLDIYTEEPKLRRDINPFNGEPAELWGINIHRDNIESSFFILSKHRARFKKTTRNMLWEVVSITPTGKNELVWCVVEPEDQEFTLSNGILTKNCAFTVIDEPIRPFTWTMDMLMLGSGVGFSIQREHVSKLPAVKKTFEAPVRRDSADADFIIPDTREGWVALLERTLESAFARRKAPRFSYSTQLIRGKGTIIKGFGGVASGPEALCEGITNISTILTKRAGKQLRPIDCLDIMNIIGSIVVAGNVRRSAQLAIGDPDDVEYLLAKRWDLGNIPSWRAMSNNSVACDDLSQLHEFFWDGYEGRGEPYGLINLKLSREIGRLGETQYPDPTVMGYNPCVTGDTIISTPNGDIRMDELVNQINLDQIPLVHTYNTNTGEVESKPVLWGALTRESAEIIELELDNGQLLKLTPDHKVYTQNRGYVEAKYLTADDTLIEIIMEKTRTVKIHTVRRVMSENVYDINVADNHNFFANGLLVHNCGEQSLGNFETCVTGNTRIQTREGSVFISDVVGKEIEVYNGESWSKTTPFMAKDKDTFTRIHFSDGSYLDVNADHEFEIYRNKSTKAKKIKTNELQIGDALPKFELPTIDGEIDPNAYTMGVFCGDGYNEYLPKRLDGTRAITPMVCLAESKSTLLDHINTKAIYPPTDRGSKYESIIRARIVLDSTIAKQLRDPDMGLPDIIMSFNTASARAFIAGLIDTDGHAGINYRIFGTSEAKMRDLQLLCRRAGINYATLRIAAKKGTNTNMGTRNYDLYQLTIPGFECSVVPTRMKKVTIQPDRYKNNNAHPTGRKIDSAHRQRVIRIEPLSIQQPSYCFSEPIRHMGVFGNVLTYQCCLAELFLPKVESYDEFLDLIKLLYRINKHSLALQCHHKETEKIVNANMRMGIGITGYLQATKEQKSWLSKAYVELREFDRQYSEKMGWPVSVKLTTCKPSGTLSLLPGVTPGCHPGYAQYMIRRIAMSSNHELVDVCRKHGYDVEYRRNFDGSLDYSTSIVSFPFSFPEGTVLAKDMTAIQQLKIVKEIQQHWSDNSVSVTVYYRPEELPEIKKYLAKHFTTGYKSLSFLLHSEHGFQQAPYEEITKEQYDAMVAKTTLITSIENGEIGIDDDCVGGVCPVR